MTKSTQRFERLTVNLVPETPSARFTVPSTFNSADRMYGWKAAGPIEYLIVPTRVTSAGVTVDLFLHPQGKGKAAAADAQHLAEQLVKAKISSEWKGLRLAGIERAPAGAPPAKVFRRGRIEEILGIHLEI